MKFKNGELESVSKFILNEFSLSGKHNRMRMKFLKLLSKKQEEFESFRIQLLKEHSELDEHGEIKTILSDGKPIAVIKDMEAYQNAYVELANEEAVIEENEENKEMLLFLQAFLNDCDVVFKGRDAIMHEFLCEKFETIYP